MKINIKTAVFFKKIIFVFILAFIFNWIWENAHSYLYVHYQGGPITQLLLLRAAFIDAFFITTLWLFFQFTPYFKKKIWLAVIFAVIAAIILEKYALSSGRWAYNEYMPIIPVLHTGITPTIQLGILSFFIFKYVDEVLCTIPKYFGILYIIKQMSIKIKIIIGAVAAIFIVLVVLLLITKTSPSLSLEPEVRELNSQFVDLLKQKTPSWDAYPAVRMWWEAKVAKERGDFNLSKRKLEEAIDLLKPVEKVSYDEILKYAGVSKHPIPKGKLQPPENGAYTGVWQAPIFCSPANCPKGGFDQTTDSHSALMFFTSIWYSIAPAYNYNFDIVMTKMGHFGWDNLFSFEDSFILNPTMGKKDRQPLILSFKQEAELLAQYGTVMVLSWIMGYPAAEPDWAGGKDYHSEKMEGKAPTVPEILNGKWDDYIRKVAREVKNINASLLIELTHEFNAPTMINNAFWSFGADSDKASLEICNSNYTKDDMIKSMEDMTALVWKIKNGEIKADCPELYNQYGNLDIPDGPERQRDIWIRVKKIFDEENVKNVARFEHTGDNFGTGFVNTVLPWSKIDYYWPGDKNIDFIGTSVYYQDTKSVDSSRNQPDDASTFHASANLAKVVKDSKYWKNTPVLFLEFASMTGKTEEEDIKRIFCDYLPKDFKNVKGFTFLDWPPSFGAPAEIAAWKQCISNNPYYIKYPVIKTD